MDSILGWLDTTLGPWLIVSRKFMAIYHQMAPLTYPIRIIYQATERLLIFISPLAGIEPTIYRIMHMIVAS